MLLLMQAVRVGEKGRSLLVALFRSPGGGLSGLGSLLRMGIGDWRLGRGRCGWMRCGGRVLIRSR